MIFYLAPSNIHEEITATYTLQYLSSAAGWNSLNIYS